MRTVFVLFALLAVAIPAAPLAIQQTTEKPIEIVGKDTPAKIPEWLRWEHVLARVGEFTEMSTEERPHVLPGTLFLPKAELLTIKNEGGPQAARKKALREETQKLLDSFDRNGKTPEQVLREMHRAAFELELVYRLQVLEVRDRLLTTVKPESALAIEQWIGEVVVPRLRVHLHPLDIQNFAIPR